MKLFTLLKPVLNKTSSLGEYICFRYSNCNSHFNSINIDSVFLAVRKYKCNQCNKTHKIPIDEQCLSVLHNDSLETVNSDQQQFSDFSSQILAELEW